MKNYYTNCHYNDIAMEVDAVTRETSRSWPRIANLLSNVEFYQYWQNDSTSFSDWVRVFSTKLGLKESSVWRILASSRIYSRLRHELSARAFDIPALEELPHYVSPEKIEILEKVRRVAGPDVTDSLVRKVIDGSITRASLRLTWEAYRPVLKGRTARGRGVAAPRYVLAELGQHDSLLEAEFTYAFQTMGPNWTGTVRPIVYRMFAGVRPEKRKGDQRLIELALVVVVREKLTSPMVFHGIEICLPRCLASESSEKFRILADQFCDFFWIAARAPCVPFESELADLPETIGIFGLDNGTVKVVRAATRSVNAGAPQRRSCKALLAKLT